MIFISVDLPAPFSPEHAVNPAATSAPRSTRSHAVTAPYRLRDAVEPDCGPARLGGPVGTGPVTIRSPLAWVNLVG